MVILQLTLINRTDIRFLEAMRSMDYVVTSLANGNDWPTSLPPLHYLVQRDPGSVGAVHTH